MGRSKAQLITNMATKMMSKDPATAQDVYMSLRAQGCYYLPTVREISFALRTDKRFFELGKVKVGSLVRNRSHDVCLWGRTDINYN
jgi:hypothetical protein|tara:strand:- start:1677 stop:1934 length:258 start_codon:yes stop_codon:yes gene_type:complete